MSKQSIGQWFKAHYQARQEDAGTFATAKQMRKQGVPLNVALAILVGRVA